MTIKHTPGPWQARAAIRAVGSDRHDVGICAVSGFALVAECFADIRYAREDAEDECAANARLIAAAPDLLEALRQIVNLCGGKEPYGTMRAVWRVADAAIVKATGEV